MAYIDDVCQPLIHSLEHFARLQTFQLAGHAANAHFWVEESQHCLQIIDGYYDRFKTLQQAQQEQVARHRVVQAQIGPDGRPIGDYDASVPPLKRNVKDHQLKELRLNVVESLRRFLKRCRNEDLLKPTDVLAFGVQIGTDFSDIA